MKPRFVVLCLSLLASLALPTTASAHKITGEVIAVADGDTITVREAEQDYRIRLNGIDAPETAQLFGKKSKQNLSDLLSGNQVTVIWNKTDRYGRYIGTVTIGSVDAGLHQIKTGFAWYFRRYESDVPEIERHLYAEAEAKAKAQKLGLWSQSNPTAPWDWRDRKEPPAAARPIINSAPSTGSGKPRSSDSESRRAYSVQCGATTKRGTRCKRMTLSPNGHCRQHGGN